VKPTDLDLKRLYLRLYRAVRRADPEQVGLLIRDHPELHDLDGLAGTPLEMIDHYSPHLLEVAFQAGLHPNAHPGGRPQTLLQHAVANGHLERVRLLIRYGVDLETRNDWGEVALGYACSWGQLEAAKVLVEAGADVNAIEHNPERGYRYTPLDCAQRYPWIADYLRKHGAKLLSELEADEPGIP
jgi:hypothetical protein